MYLDSEFSRIQIQCKDTIASTKYSFFLIYNKINRPLYCQKCKMPFFVSQKQLVCKCEVDPQLATGIIPSRLAEYTDIPQLIVSRIAMFLSNFKVDGKAKHGSSSYRKGISVLSLRPATCAKCSSCIDKDAIQCNSFLYWASI